MNLREEFNRMDHEALDNDEKFYDLRSLVEAVTLTQQDKKNLQNYINKNDAKGANDYLQGLLSGKPITNNTSNLVAGLQTTQETINESDDVDWDDDWDMPADEVTACEWCEETSPIDDLVKTNIGWICRDCIQELDSRGEPYIVFHNANYYDELDESLLTEGIYDAIRAIVPKGTTAQELVRDIYKILDRQQYGVAPKNSFVDIFSTIGGDLKRALAKLVDHGIKASIISHKLPESMINERNLTRAERHQRDMDRIFQNYDRMNNAKAQFLIDKGIDPDEVERYKQNTGLSSDGLGQALIDLGLHDEFWNQYNSQNLTEGRYDLVPVKCTSIESKQPYWSPYDKKEGEYAEYGTRFRYDTRQGCQDAINDPEKDLGYDIDGKKKYRGSKERELEERLILEEDEPNIDSEEQTQDDSYIVFGNKKVPVRGVDPRVLKMIGSPLTAKGEPKMEAWLLIKLYEETTLKGVSKISRSELLRIAGVANWNTAGQSSTYFSGFSKLNLAYTDGNGYVTPGSYLKDWIEGNYRPSIPQLYNSKGKPSNILGSNKHAGEPYAGGVDLTGFLGKGDNETKQSQGGQPNRSHYAGDNNVIKTNDVSSVEQGEMREVTQYSYSPELFKIKTGSNMSEILANNSVLSEGWLSDKLYSLKGKIADSELNIINSIMKKYKQKHNLSSTDELTPNNIKKWDLKTICDYYGVDIKRVWEKLFNEPLK